MTKTRRTRVPALALAVGVLSLLAALASAQPPAITHGVAAGDVTDEGAVIWARADRAAEMTVTVGVDRADGVEWEAAAFRASATAVTDFTAQATVSSLLPDTRYRYRVHFTDAAGQRSAEDGGTFRTAPRPDAPAPVSFLVSGDLGGQQYCRLVEGGYRIFGPMTALDADFFVANGDMIYADNDCPERGSESKIYVPGDFPGVADATLDWRDRSAIDEVYRAHWRYNRADPGHQEFLRRTPVYVQWDDHEVVNDFGGPWPFYLALAQRPGYPNLVAAGRQSFFDYHPMRRSVDEPERIYRSFRWGRDLELFLLDARSYRSRNDLADDADQQKTMLGRAQLEWLVAALSASDATWKVVSSDVPLSVPTGLRAELFGRDAWASGEASDFSSRTGFERELLELLQRLDQAKVRNLVFVTTDVHFAMQARYSRDFDGDGVPLRFYELVSGPLSAIKTPRRPELDQSLEPEVLFAEGGLFNFAYLRLGAADGNALPDLIADVRDEAGNVRPGSELVIKAEAPAVRRP